MRQLSFILLLSVATNHPGKESFDGELARFLLYERPLTDDELQQTEESLKKSYAIP